MKYYTQKLPRWWWINPWSHVVHLHKAVMAMNEYIRSQEHCIDTIEENHSKKMELLARDRDRAIYKLYKQNGK